MNHIIHVIDDHEGLEDNFKNWNLFETVYTHENHFLLVFTLESRNYNILMIVEFTLKLLYIVPSGAIKTFPKYHKPWRLKENGMIVNLNQCLCHVAA